MKNEGHLKYFTGIYIMLLLSSGCDVPGHLILKNKTKQDVIVSLRDFPSGWSDQDMRTIKTLKNGPPIYFTYGLDGFPPEWLELLDRSFKDGKVINGTDTSVIDDQERLKTMFPKKVTEVMNSRMKIKIRE